MTTALKDNWVPSDGVQLDENAISIVQSSENMSILAGPGAGKTELLAQRASFLLETGTCRPPSRILAITFKVDAARNLQDRVEKRCSEELAQRFDAMTLDAFAKRILDQFREALPEELRPSPNYTIFFPNRDIWNDFAQRYGETYASLNAKKHKALDSLVHRNLPPSKSDEVCSEDEGIRYSWWRENIAASPSRLTFDMIKVLANAVVVSQPLIMAAIRNTYAYVFLDEFQDVTAKQYELITSCFKNSSSIMTAVGDGNQAIMRWAGAEEAIFDDFVQDFGAVNKNLSLNFRSNRRIVDLMNSLAAGLWDDYIPTSSVRGGSSEYGSGAIGWISSDREAEGKNIARKISAELKSNGALSPSDFCLLARLKVDQIEECFAPQFSSFGLDLRNEARFVGKVAIQDLMKDTFFRFVVSAMRLATGHRDGNPFSFVRNTVAELQGLDLATDKGHTGALRSTRILTEDVSAAFEDAPVSSSSDVVVQVLLNHFDQTSFRNSFREYTGGDRLEDVIHSSAEFLGECMSASSDWSDLFDRIDGKNSVKLMTIHKSKGLEFHTVVFLDLNDDAFWGNSDDSNVFFVALSRAIERVVFSFRKDAKGIGNVKHLYDLLSSSGVSFKELQQPL